jgi:Zn finger protein HypA/HybF involved in hydrogenase expression
MIFIECAWCENGVPLDGLDATSVECPDCHITVELAQDDPHIISFAA